MSKASYRLHAISVLIRREIWSNYYSLGLYLAVTIAFLGASLSVNSYVSSVAQNGLMSIRSPLTEPLNFAVVIGAAYLALCSAISISRERDQGTLEVLFYGPVDSVSYVLARFLEQLITFAILILVYLIFFSILSAVTNLGLNWYFLAQAIMSVLLGSSIIGFGILLSCLTKKARTSIILFLSLTALFILVDVAADILTNMGTDKYTTSPIVFIRSVVLSLRDWLSWVNPFEYLQRGVFAISANSMVLFIRRLLESLLYTAVLLFGSVYFFNRKGVRR